MRKGVVEVVWVGGGDEYAMKGRREGDKMGYVEGGGEIEGDGGGGEELEGMGEVVERS